jgi:hypothetical protein
MRNGRRAAVVAAAILVAVTGGAIEGNLGAFAASTPGNAAPPASVCRTVQGAGRTCMAPTPAWLKAHPGQDPFAQPPIVQPPTAAPGGVAVAPK